MRAVASPIVSSATPLSLCREHSPRWLAPGQAAPRWQAGSSGYSPGPGRSVAVAVAGWLLYVCTHFRMKTDRIRVESDPDITFLPHFNTNTNINSDIFKYEYKTDVSDLDLYSDIYSSQLKLYILNLTYMDKISILITLLTKVS
jgi:hypothetical protein